jgi:hypothetical protein
MNKSTILQLIAGAFLLISYHTIQAVPGTSTKSDYTSTTVIDTSINRPSLGFYPIPAHVGELVINAFKTNSTLRGGFKYSSNMTITPPSSSNDSEWKLSPAVWTDSDYQAIANDQMADTLFTEVVTTTSVALHRANTPQLFQHETTAHVAETKNSVSEPSILLLIFVSLIGLGLLPSKNLQHYKT